MVNKLVVEKKSITVDIFIDVIKKEWEEIEPEILLNLILSMLKKLEQIIERNGKYLQFFITIFGSYPLSIKHFFSEHIFPAIFSFGKVVA